jgi:hypothetical protein
MHTISAAANAFRNISRIALRPFTGLSHLMIDGVLFVERRERIGISSIEGFDELQGYFFGFHPLRLADVSQRFNSPTRASRSV